MNAFAILFLLINSLALLMLPRRWAPLPLLVGACYMTLGQGIELGSFHFPLIRMLIAVGLVRVIIRGERLVGRMNSLDWLMMVWAAWALISSLFHKDAFGALVSHLGLVYNACGIYFLLRVFCQSLDDVVMLCRITAILLIPLSIMILFEKMTGHNLFSALGGVSEISEIRDGRIRAQGPFAHSITRRDGRCGMPSVNDWPLATTPEDCDCRHSGMFLNDFCIHFQWTNYERCSRYWGIVYVALSPPNAACPMACSPGLYRTGSGYEGAGVLPYSAHRSDGQQHQLAPSILNRVGHKPPL